MYGTAPAEIVALHCLTVLCQLGFFLTLFPYPKLTAARFLGKIFLAGLCQQHKNYPRVYIWHNHIRQATAATCHNIGSNIKGTHIEKRICSICVTPHIKTAYFFLVLNMFKLNFLNVDNICVNRAFL